MSTGKPLKLIPEPQLKATHREWMQVLDMQASKHFETLMRINGL